MFRMAVAAATVLGVTSALQEAPQMKKLTPIVFVQTIEPCLPFWTEGLGFEITATVPQGDALGFAMLQRGPVEVMYQTLESLEADLPALAEGATAGFTTMFLEVDQLDPHLDAVEDFVLVPRRQTFYGMDEIALRAPCGSVVILAARIEE